MFSRYVRLQIIILLAALTLAGCGYVFQLPAPPSSYVPPTKTPSPAGKFCMEKGGSLEARQYPDFTWYEICVFADGSECEVDAFSKNTCQPGQQAEVHPIPPDMLITLERSVCMTPCPVYRISIDAQGNVAYEGISSVKVDGIQHSKISQDDVWRLLEAFRKARYFQKFNSYTRMGTTCGTNIYTSLTINGRTKRIKRYTGSPAPPDLEELELLIDEVTNSAQWTE